MKSKALITRTLLPTAAWLVIWQLVAMAVHNHVLLAGPIDTLNALIRLSGEQEFWSSVWSTTFNILLGFLIGSLLGAGLAMLGYFKEPVGDFLKPLILAMKSVPVASFVILLLIWFGNRNIAVVICALVVFPVLYLNTFEGLCGTDVKMLEMAKIYRIPALSKIRYIFLPQLHSFLRGALKLAIGMAFKSGIAAEVIGQPLHTIGNGLYQAKIFLETGELFAWTIVVVVISFICEKILMAAVDCFRR
ncbi:MAG: ABC transporter permease subunit [Butyrivibrio sp.]|nr:ABC transporter permease subunit [Butyrivibrio sp.]